MMNFIKTAIQADLKNLNLLLVDPASKDCTELEFNYLKALSYYLRGENALLRKCVELKDNDKLLKAILLLRLEIKEFNIQNINIKKLEQEISHSNLSQVWIAEAYFVLGLALCEIEKFEESKKYYKMAYSLFWSLDVKKKAVKSLLNYVVCISREPGERRLFLDYDMVCERALEIGDLVVAGICQLNIAREYRLFGAHELALKFINIAVENLQSDRGTNHYYYAILERCLIYIEMKEYNKAYLDYQNAKLTNLVDIQESLKVIKNKLGTLNEDLNNHYLDPAWVECLNNSKILVKNNLTKTEVALIEFLSQGKQNKLDIIIQLYGEKISFDSAENRFKVLLSRLRKKYPNIISFSGNYYELSDKIESTEANYFAKAAI